MHKNRRFKVIRDAKLLDAKRHEAVDADVLIDGTKISEIGPHGLTVPEDAQVINGADRLLIPGLVNTHTHAHGALAKGLVGDRFPLELFLNSVPALVRERTLEDKYLCGLINAIEMVEKGCTVCFDMFTEFPLPSWQGIEALGCAYQEVGVRAVIAPMMADKTLYQALPGLIDSIPKPLRGQVETIQTAPFEASLRACKEILRRWNFDHSYITPALAPTIPLHCSDDFLIGCRDLAAEYGVALQTHLAETRLQAALGLKKYGCSLIAHLDRLNFLGPRLSAAHAIWIDNDDIQRMADRGTKVVHNPASNMRIGSGLAAVSAMRQAGVTVGLGTDATNTSDQLNMFEAQRLASFVSRISSADVKNWLTPVEVFAMATEGSAAVLGEEHRLGRLAIGYQADIVFLDLGHIHYWPLHDIVGQLVFSETGAAVTDVFVAGRQLLKNRQHTTVDVAAIRRKVEKAALRLAESSAKSIAFARQLEGYVGAFCSTQLRQ